MISTRHFTLVHYVIIKNIFLSAHKNLMNFLKFNDHKIRKL